MKPKKTKEEDDEFPQGFGEDPDTFHTDIGEPDGFTEEALEYGDGDS